MALLWVTRRTLLPPASIVKICEPPSRDSVTANVRPSGDQVGALLLPRKLAIALRSPVETSCDHTTALPLSNDT